jgi:hypothetical protein
MMPDHPQKFPQTSQVKFTGSKRHPCGGDVATFTYGLDLRSPRRKARDRRLAKAQFTRWKASGGFPK